jgi:peptidoglycan L-alanyl-D-glutamate endopeptidase CwlK
MINSRAISDLNDAAKAKASAFKAKCLKEGIDVLIYCTYRDHEQQSALYAVGRDKKGRVIDAKAILTNADAGDSFHNWRCAWDAVPLIGGKPQWRNAELYLRMGVIAESLGIEWAGRWKTFKERAHFQYTGGATLADYQSGKIQFA